MARLPIIGSDSGTWGSILNDFLKVSHNSDGTLSSSALTQAGALTESAADSQYVKSSSVGTASGVASLDSTGNVPSGQLGNVSGGVTSYSIFITEDVACPNGQLTMICSQTLEPGTYVASFAVATYIDVVAILPHANPYVPGDAVLSNTYNYGNVVPGAFGAVLVVTETTQYDLVSSNFTGSAQPVFAEATDGGGNVFPNATGITFLKIG